MSWIGGEMILDSDSKKELAVAQDYIRSQVRDAGNCGEFSNLGDYLLPIKKKITTPCKSYADAKEQADKFNWERNYNILVPFKDVDRVKPTKKMQNLKDRIKKEEDKLYNYIEKTDCQNYKSKYIGCPQCGSKINKDYIHNSRCPLCREDLRSDTTKKTIERYKNNITKARTDLRVEKEKLASKAKTKYLLLFEEYCG